MGKNIYQTIFSLMWELIRIVPIEFCPSSPRNTAVRYHQSQYPQFLLFSPLLELVQISTGPSAPLNVTHPKTHAIRTCCTIPPVSIVLVDSLVHVLLKVCEFWKDNRKLRWTTTTVNRRERSLPEGDISLFKGQWHTTTSSSSTTTRARPNKQPKRWHKSPAVLTISYRPPARKENPHGRLPLRGADPIHWAVERREKVKEGNGM